MFSHIMVGANDIEASKKFYDAVLGALGHAPGTLDPKGRCFYMTPTGIFSLSVPINGEAACGANGGTVGFAAASHALHIAASAKGPLGAGDDDDANARALLAIGQHFAEGLIHRA